MAPGSAARLVDIDEFEANSSTYGYPDQLVKQARATAASLIDRAQRGKFSFHCDRLDVFMATLKFAFHY